MDLVIGALGLLTAVVGTYFGYRFGRRSEFAIFEWMREIRSWSEKVLLVLSEAAYGLVSSDCTDSDRRRWAAELSALIELGRFYLPNQHQDASGLDRPAAYRGYRHAALDPLVAAVRLLGSREANDDQLLIELRREFVSTLFMILGPDHHNREIARMIRDSHRNRRRDQTAGGLVASADAIPVGATDLLEEIRTRIGTGNVRQERCDRENMSPRGFK